MAEIIGKAGKWVGQTLDSINSRAIDKGGIFEGSIHDYTQGPTNKAWRLLILAQRRRPDMPKDSWRAQNSGPKPPDGTVDVDSIITTLRDKQKRDKSTYAASNHNQIIIINTNTSPVTSIILQNRPSTIQVNSLSYWVSVKSMGRNNPFMMYTGGEDSIQLEVSWFVNDPNNRNEVLTKCRLLESWSKADGYSASPPTLKISWGSANIFENDLFILENANYQLSNFQSYTKTYHKDTSSEATDIGLAPQCATQTLVFKRVSPNNRTHLEMVSREELEKVRDIKMEE